MVGTMLSVGLSFVFFVVVLCDVDVPVGPPALMRRLSDEEFEDLRSICKYPKIDAIEDRIIGGEYVDAHFAKPTVAIMNAAGTYRCVATFITRRHLVTAGHCFHSLFSSGYVNGPDSSNPQEAPAPYLLVGGVCIRRTKDMCVDTDTERREIDFVIYDLESRVDLAIIQLRKDQKEYHGTEFLPACIYDTYATEGTDEQPPERFEIYGWGRIRNDENPGK